MNNPRFLYKIKQVSNNLFAVCISEGIMTKGIAGRDYLPYKETFIGGIIECKTFMDLHKDGLITNVL